MSDLQQQIDALAARVAQLEAANPLRLGPRTETPEQSVAREARVVEAIVAAVAKDAPPVDRTKLCTTDGRSPEEARASQTNETGQHASYIVLCDEERAKGFVRPYRDSYKHVGRRVCGKPRAFEGDPKRLPVVCTDEPGHAGDCVVWAPVESERALAKARDEHVLGGCGTVTRMGRALSETYARDPGFYGATFCCGCNRHLAVAEFVWTADGQQVGS